jgi:hypothetical protein
MHSTSVAVIVRLAMVVVCVTIPALAHSADADRDTVRKKTGPQVASSPTYGYTEKEPVMVGGGISDGVARSYAYLDALRGPKGEPVTYSRRGHCCPFETKNSELGAGLLDVYELTYKGLSKPLVIYINMYDRGEIMIPQGLTKAK